MKVRQRLRHQSLKGGVRGFAMALALLSPFMASAAQDTMILPTVAEVKPTEPLAIDGLWAAEGTDDRFRIDRGRVYAVDERVTLGILKIEPNSVIVKNLERTGKGTYRGYDLSVLGRWSAKLMSNRTLVVSVDGTLKRTTFSLTPVEVKDRKEFIEEVEVVRQTTLSSEIARQPKEKPAD